MINMRCVAAACNLPQLIAGFGGGAEPVTLSIIIRSGGQRLCMDSPTTQTPRNLGLGCQRPPTAGK